MKMLRITLEGKTYDVGVEVLSNENAPVSIHLASNTSLAAPSPATFIAQALTPKAIPGEGCSFVVSPMAGLVFKIMVKVGDVVTINQVVMVLDAMKMETPICSTVAGTVRAILVKEGDAVDEGYSLIEIEGGQ